MSRKEGGKEQITLAAEHAGGRTMVPPLLLVLLALLRLAGSEAPPIALSNCSPACGNVSIPYPFGISAGCFHDGFKITCMNNIAYLSDTNITVKEIQLSSGLLTVYHEMAYDCYTAPGELNSSNNEPTIDLLGTPNFKFSNERNKFVAVGCDTLGYIWNHQNGTFWTGCLAFCTESSLVPSGGCSGIGCCTAPIPSGLRNFSLYVTSFRNHRLGWSFNRCGYGFLADESWLNFSLASFSELAQVEKVPVTLDWAIMNQTCDGTHVSACIAANSYCVDSPNGPGYLCNCSQGFQGNPYLHDGCQDVNECTGTNSLCVLECTNSVGGYYCSCPWHMYGDGRVAGSGCKSILKQLYLGLGVGLIVFLIIASASWLYWIFKKKELIELRRQFFQQNGGYLLQQQLTGITRPATKVFSSEELRVATSNYRPSHILGEGGAGTVYKGILPDQAVVAIKKSKLASDDVEVQQFINEVVILSHVNHRNVVKLLGCCLETQAPMLVYEFVPNGTLAHHIHDEGCRGSLSLKERLRIASEVAGALSYLHSAASTPIIHRDVKSTNILLDENLTAKVSDFGASRLVPLDHKGLVSLVRGTFGYLDPEYFQCGEFTDKSDVYSFGVVLVELLTGENPTKKTRFAECRNLANLFLLYVNDGCYVDILEARVVSEGTQELVRGIVVLAKSCLSLRGDDRPSMREVAMELDGLRTLTSHPWVNDEQDAESLESLCVTPPLGQYRLALPQLVKVKSSFHVDVSSPTTRRR